MTAPHITVRLSRCWPCMLADQPDDHPNRPHTWMDDDDIDADPAVTAPTTADGWTALAGTRPCNCTCHPKETSP